MYLKANNPVFFFSTLKFYFGSSLSNNLNKFTVISKIIFHSFSVFLTLPVPAFVYFKVVPKVKQTKKINVGSNPAAGNKIFATYYHILTIFFILPKYSDLT